MKDKAINVIYITSRGHSGSTLLAHLLGAHPSIVGVGEIKMLSQDKDERKLCSCLSPADSFSMSVLGLGTGARSISLAMTCHLLTS